VQTWKGLTLTNETTTETRMLRTPMINLWDGISPGIDTEVREFIRCIREDREPPVTAEDGLEDLRVIMAIYESSRKGEKVAL
jgi:predicted dehydrogenase